MVVKANYIDCKNVKFLVEMLYMFVLFIVMFMSVGNLMSSRYV